MSKFIDADRLRAEIENRIEATMGILHIPCHRREELVGLLSFVDSLHEEQPEVDLEKLGEIARHIIAVKENVEDMRLNEDEWSLLERIGYPERFNARKEG